MNKIKSEAIGPEIKSPSSSSSSIEDYPMRRRCGFLNGRGLCTSSSSSASKHCRGISNVNSIIGGIFKSNPNPR
ncbi:hypothetical protein M5K25_019656 [Dendrobium thyrsiflorum]|uniref:Uncharacterized protein n=1 Tax=Dendrobium thyrsiflorum TaxID=117978 RepID=A0ABD0UFK3_DENTH